LNTSFAVDAQAEKNPTVSNRLTAKGLSGKNFMDISLPLSFFSFDWTYV
jgi:hypothetical protein